MRCICVVLLASCLMTGCALLRDACGDLGEQYEDSALHGKVGVGWGAVLAVPAGVVVAVLTLPITVPISIHANLTTSGGCMGEGISRNAPLFAFVVGCGLGYYGGYYAGTACAYPLHLLAGEAPHRLRLAPMSDEAVVDRLVQSMPYVSEADYGRLARASRRSYPRPYWPDFFHEGSP